MMRSAAPYATLVAGLALAGATPGAIANDAAKFWNYLKDRGGVVILGEPFGVELADTTAVRSANGDTLWFKIAVDGRVEEMELVGADACVDGAVRQNRPGDSLAVWETLYEGLDGQHLGSVIHACPLSRPDPYGSSPRVPLLPDSIGVYILPFLHFHGAPDSGSVRPGRPKDTI